MPVSTNREALPEEDNSSSTFSGERELEEFFKEPREWPFGHFQGRGSARIQDTWREPEGCPLQHEVACATNAGCASGTSGIGSESRDSLSNCAAGNGRSCVGKGESVAVARPSKHDGGRIINYLERSEQEALDIGDHQNFIRSKVWRFLRDTCGLNQRTAHSLSQAE
jgi:hypothetical protein